MLACDAWVAKDVGAVVLAANAHLHNGDVHALAPEDVEGEDGHELEVGRPVVRGPALTHLHTQQQGINLVETTYQLAHLYAAAARYKFSSNNLPAQLCTVSSVADPDPGSWIRCLFDPWIQDPGWVKN